MNKPMLSSPSHSFFISAAEGKDYLEAIEVDWQRLSSFSHESKTLTYF
jgi:hypothetical protein